MTIVRMKIMWMTILWMTIIIRLSSMVLILDFFLLKTLTISGTKGCIVYKLYIYSCFVNNTNTIHLEKALLAQRDDALCFTNILQTANVCHHFGLNHFELNSKLNLNSSPLLSVLSIRLINQSYQSVESINRINQTYQSVLSTSTRCRSKLAVAHLVSTRWTSINDIINGQMTSNWFGYNILIL